MWVKLRKTGVDLKCYLKLLEMSRNLGGDQERDTKSNWNAMEWGLGPHSFDFALHPILNVGFNPSNSAIAKSNLTWEISARHLVINGGLRQTGNGSDLGETQEGGRGGE